MATITTILEREGYITLNKHEGGFADVHKVRSKEYNHVRAMKIIKGEIESENDRRYQTFLSECKKLFRLSCGGHPNIVRIYRHMLIENRAIVEMDFIKGDSLEECLIKNNNFIPIDEVLKMLTDISSALSYCHVDVYKYCYDRVEDNLPDDPNDAQNVIIDDEARKRLISKYRIVHNDMHDRNVMRREDGTYLLLDFGLAVDNSESDRSSRIANGVMLFKAPEKWAGKKITASVDVYGFGVMLYEYLAGRLPFVFTGSMTNQDDIYKFKEKHCKETPPPIFPLRKQAFEATHPGKTMETPDYPEWLEELIMKCLAKDPKDRFADGKELYDFVKGKLNHLWTEYHKILQQSGHYKKELDSIQEQHAAQLKAIQNAVTCLKQECEEEKEKKQKEIDALNNQLLTAQNKIKQLEELRKKDEQAKQSKEHDIQKAVTRLKLQLESKEKECGRLQSQISQLKNELECAKQNSTGDTFEIEVIRVIE